MEIIKTMDAKQFPLIENITIKSNRKPSVVYPGAENTCYARKEKYANLTMKERHASYIRSYYNKPGPKSGKMYYAIKSRCNKFNMEKSDFDGCESIEDVDDRVDIKLKQSNYPDEVIKLLTTYRRKRKE